MNDRARRSLRFRSAVVAVGAVASAAFLARWLPAPTAARSAASGGERLDTCRLPNGSLVYARSIDSEGPVPPSRGGPAPAVNLCVSLPDGSGERRITFGAAQDRSPALLPDGRIAFRRRPLGADGPGRLFAVNTDGTGLVLSGECQPAPGAGLPPEVLAAPQPKPLNLTSVVDETKTTGTLLCLDVRSSRLASVSRLDRGAIRSVRVLSTGGEELARAPVAADGSFFVQVPADRPLRLDLLGPDGVVATDSSGFWVRPNENRGCLGCHEDPELSPENRLPLALQVGPPPVKGPPVSVRDGNSSP